MPRIEGEEGGRRAAKAPGLTMTKKLMTIALGLVFLFSAVKLISISYRNYEGNKSYDKMRQEMTVLEKPTVKDDSQANTADEPESEPEPVPEPEPNLPPASKTEAVRQLKDTYSDLIGWVYLGGTKIDYPVMQASDNDKYMDRLADGSRSSYGSIFADYRNSPDFTDRNTVVYGHNMKGGAMLASLTNYANQEFYDNNRIIYLDTDTESLECIVFSAYVTKADGEVYRREFKDDADYSEYLNWVYGRSLVNTNIDMNGVSRIVTFSTCTNIRDEDRFVVQAVVRKR